MHVLLFRHGQTDENARGILQGQSQTMLNRLGHRQAELLAERLRTYQPRIETLVTSDLVRARQTADAIATALGIDYVEREVWRERSFGPFEGRTIGEADIWRAANGHWDLPGAESTDAFHARIERAVYALIRDCSGARCVGVVTHGAVLRNLLNLLREGRVRLAEGLAPPASVPIANCAILHLEVGGIDETVPAWRVHVVNDVDHLGGDTCAAFQVEG